eukprot:UN24894
MVFLVREENEFCNTVLGAEGKELSSLLNKLFRSLYDIFNGLTKDAHSADPLNSLALIRVSDSKLQWCYQNKEDFLAQQLMRIQGNLAQQLNKYVEEQIYWIDNYNPSVKVAGILTPFLKLPSFLKEIDQIRRMTFDTAKISEKSISFEDKPPVIKKRSMKRQPNDGDDHNVGNLITKVISQTFKWLRKVAAKNPKYSDVVQMENHWFFLSVLYRCNIPSVRVYVAQSKKNS